LENTHMVHILKPEHKDGLTIFTPYPFEEFLTMKHVGNLHQNIIV